MSQTKAQLISDLVQSLNFAGTASAPANGMYLSAANTIKLSTNTTPRLTIDSSGNATFTGTVTATSFVGGLPITSGADNRVITASSASAIQGEANLTFSGSILQVTGQGSFSGAITASTYIQGTSSNGGLKFYSDSSASKGVTLNTDDHLVPTHDSISDLGLTGTRWRNVYADTFIGALTGNASGSAATVTGAAQTAITSVGTLTSLQITNHLGLGVAAAEFGSGVKTIVLKGAASTKSGCIDFKDNDSSTRLANIFVQNDSTYGMSIGTSCSGEDGDFIRFHTGTLGSTKMIIKSDGKVGIGTTSPATSLEIASTDAIIRLSDTNNSAAANDLIGELQFYSNDADGAHIGGYVKAIQDPSDAYGRRTALLLGTQTTGDQANEKVRIDHLGNVGIGMTPSVKFHIVDSSATETECIKLRNYKSSVNTKPMLTFEAVTSSNQGANSHIKGVAGTDAGGSNSSNDSGMQFCVRYGGSHTEREAFTINKDGNIVFPNGQGINFSATATGGTAQSSELLNDYEEGTWNAASLNYDYDGNQAQRGQYVKIGRMVYAFYRIKFHTQSNYIGQHLRWTALPFTVQGTSSPNDIGVGAHAHEYGSIDFFRLYVQPGSTYCYWYDSDGDNYNNTTSLNNADVRGCIIYRASF